MILPDAKQPSGDSGADLPDERVWGVNLAEECSGLRCEGLHHNHPQGSAPYGLPEPPSRRSRLHLSAGAKSSRHAHGTAQTERPHIGTTERITARRGRPC